MLSLEANLVTIDLLQRRLEQANIKGLLLTLEGSFECSHSIDHQTIDK